MSLPLILFLRRVKRGIGLLFITLYNRIYKIMFIFLIGLFLRYIISEYCNINVFSEYTNVYSILYYLIMSIISVLSFEIFSYINVPNIDVNLNPKGKFFTETNYLASNQNNPGDWNNNNSPIDTPMPDASPMPISNNGDSDNENLELYEDDINSQANNNNNNNNNAEDIEKPTRNFNEDNESNSDLWLDGESDEKEKINAKYSRRFDTIEDYKERNEMLRSSEVKDVVKKLDAGEELNDEERDTLDAIIDNTMDQHFSESRREGLHLCNIIIFFYKLFFL
jgi:hypothetical protein